MRTEPRYDGPPWRWIARHGRPAACLGTQDEAVQYRCAGLPAYEIEDGVRDDEKAKFVVMENLVGLANRRGGLMMLPRSYVRAMERAPDGLFALSPGEDAPRQWRPWLYERAATESWTGKGSQLELAWRYFLCAVQEGREAVERIWDAEAKADETLYEHLSPFQYLDWKKLKKFRVRGGLTGDVYAVRSDNGFAKIDPVSGGELYSFCLHPESWLPEADIALALKLHLENPETELDCLESAKRSKELPIQRRPIDKLIYDIEKDAAFV